ncbi:hypothetical protein BLX87_20175 [Bacillus sp. VT-16-64]|nr:hypothetical protein BLX87_20175 [Bacillus sp. VT-16-64]
MGDQLSVNAQLSKSFVSDTPQVFQNDGDHKGIALYRKYESKRSDRRRKAWTAIGNTRFEDVAA